MASSFKSILPRSPSPRASSPNPGPRSGVTHFIKSTDTTPIKRSNEASKPSSSQHQRLDSTASTSASVALSPRLSISSSSNRRPSFGIAGASRRSIAHSYRALGVDHQDEAEDALAMSQLKNGQVDVSWPEAYPEVSSTSVGEGGTSVRDTGSPSPKGKARATRTTTKHDDELFDAGDHMGDALPLADVDLEQGGSAAGRSSDWQAGRRPLYGARASSRSNLLSGLGLGSSDRNGDTTYGSEDDDEEDAGHGGAISATAAARKASYFYEVGGGGDVMSGFAAPSGFEGITARESLWMWISVAFVTALCLVAMLISTDVIDWPGDGLGKD